MAVVFLRGMNLGRRRVTNDELIAIVRLTGHSEVTAYQASGNLVFPGDDTIDDEVIARALHSGLGFEVDTFARSNDEVRAIVEHSPIAGRVGAAGGKPQIVFLRRGSRPDLTGGFPEGHEVHHIGDEVHWLPPVGLGELRGAPAAMDRALGPTTVRTLGTIERLVQRLT